MPQRRDESAAIRASGGLVDDQPEGSAICAAPVRTSAILCVVDRSLMGLLKSRGYQIDEERLIGALDEALPRKERMVATLPRYESEHLRRFAGIAPATEAQVAQLDARRTAAITAEVAQSFDRAEVAHLLGVSPSRVSHRQAEGDLYSFSAGNGRRLYPDWQFAGKAALPHLKALLRALRPEIPAAVVRRFMSTPDSDFTINGENVSPREWLLAGGAPSVVLAQASSLGDMA